MMGMYTCECGVGMCTSEYDVKLGMLGMCTYEYISYV